MRAAAITQWLSGRSVSAALAKDEIFASWWTEAWREGAVVALLPAILLFIGSRLSRQILIRDGMERELRQMHQALEESVLELDRLARTDALTGLSNWRCLGERVDTELTRARHQHTALAMIMIDIDFFKKYNDTHGHAMGDDCLRSVAQILRRVFTRSGELPARLGGEEFAVLLPGADTEQARTAAERLRQALAEQQLSHGASSVSPFVTLSIGVAQLDAELMDDFDLLLKSADQALYRAKSQGRDRVVV